MDDQETKNLKEMREMTNVILNEQHKLMDDQKRMLDERFGIAGWEIASVPKSGWDLKEMRNVAEILKNETVCFASPIPALMKLVASTGNEFYVLHNDNREKKELPNGKIIMTVAKEGWMIV
jgi:hypothetical protein